MTYEQVTRLFEIRRCPHCGSDENSYSGIVAGNVIYTCNKCYQVYQVDKKIIDNVK